MIAVFTPTCRWGGLDVTAASLARQTYKDFAWIVADDHWRERRELHWEIGKLAGVHVLSLEPCKRDGAHRDLARAYNAAFGYAVELGADLMVSLQDYIWAPADGLKRFAALHEWAPDALLTGLTDISAVPTPDQIFDPHGRYSIFEDPYTDEPDEIGWIDPRDRHIYALEDHQRIAQVMPEHWEANWAAIPTSYYDIPAVRWDERFDAGVAYENMDFAKRAGEFGARVLLDRDNRAISLPHKQYFQGEEEEIIRFSNRGLYEERWGMS